MGIGSHLRARWLPFLCSLQARVAQVLTFRVIADAKEEIELWRKDYNEVRPHSSLGRRTER